MTSSQRDRLGVIVLGKARSGTSLTANLLAAAGAYVDNSIRPDDRNPRGYWESREVVDLNRRILGFLGATLRWTPRLDPRWPESPGLDRYRPWARRILSELDTHRCWVMKDPRFSTTLPFWLPLFDRPIRFVVCIRNPLEVVGSMGSTKATLAYLTTWYEYTTLALQNTIDRPRLIVHYQRYFDRPDFPQVAQLLEFLGIESHVDVESVVSPELYRNRVSLEALLNDERVPSEVKRLYVQLLDHGEAGTDRLDHATALSVTGVQRLTRLLRTLFFRVYGPAWVTFRDSPIYPRLPSSVRTTLARTIGIWTV